MSEGEFEKHLNISGYVLDSDIHRERSIEDALRERSVWSKDEIDDDEVYLTKEQVMKMIDEARKEFPLRLSDGSIYAKFGGVSDSDTIQQLIDVIDWFVKWFGK